MGALAGVVTPVPRGRIGCPGGDLEARGHRAVDVTGGADVFCVGVLLATSLVVKPTCALAARMWHRLTDRHHLPRTQSMMNPVPRSPCLKPRDTPRTCGAF